MYPTNCTSLENNVNTTINVLNEIDTFNKLGYKAKINTYRTSCIN